MDNDERNGKNGNGDIAENEKGSYDRPAKNESGGSGAAMILFPEFEELKNEVEQLRGELSMLLLEKEQLILVECPNIEAEYMAEVGQLEYRDFKANCTVLRLRRKIELIQVSLNRRERPNIAKVEALLDDEFEEYRLRSEEFISQISSALARMVAPVLSDEDTAELKKLYRETVKKLHPDLNPNVTEAELELFERAAEAYSRGDLNSLRMIDSLLESKEEHDYGSDAMDRLVKAKRRLTQSIGETKRAIKKIKCEYPYILKTILDDKEELAAKREGLEQRIEWANDLAAGLRQKIKEMLA